MRVRTALVCGWLAALAPVGAAFAADNIVPPAKSDNMTAICVRDATNATSYHLEGARLADWYFIKYPDVSQAFDSSAALAAALASPTPLAGATDAQNKIVDSIRGGLLYMPHAGVFSFGEVDGKPFDASQFHVWEVFAAPSALPPISCQAPKAPTTAVAQSSSGGPADKSTAAKPAGSWAWSQPRLRGTSDSLVLAASDKSATGAAISLSGNALSKTYSSATTAAVGIGQTYQSSTEDQGAIYKGDVLGFAQVDESLSAVAGKQSSSNRQNLSLGVVTDFATNPQYLGGGPAQLSNAASASVEHLWNDIDRSQLDYLHFLYQPTLTGAGLFAINATPFLGSNADNIKDRPYFTPQLSFSGDFGYYDDRGEKPLVNQNYGQVGVTAGLDLVIPLIKSDFSVSQLYMAESTSARPDIKLFQAAWTITLSSTIGVKTSYENGYLEATAQRVEQWLISLTAKY